jgi:N6-adenosine-specific RNA methylase IME4
MNDLVLSKLDTARTALAEAKTIQETKNVLDVAIAAEVYAKRQRLGEEAIHYATAIKVEALRQLGNMLKETPRNKGAIPGKTGTKGLPVLDPTPTLAEMGLDKKTSKLAQDIADLPEDQFEKVKEGIVTLSKVTDEAKRAERREERIERLVDIERGNRKLTATHKYNVIYADPPWKYDYSVSSSREIENQYPTMELEDICNLPINDIAADDCILFLWATSPKLLEAIKVIEAWGFNYRTNAVWVKDKIGMGYYFRQQHEILLVANRGNIPAPEPEARVSSVIEANREEHSKKPEIVYQIIENMYGDLPKIELFSRKIKDGWDTWGNQV